MKHQITNQRDLRRAFWDSHPQCDPGVRGYDRPIATRCAFVDWIDYMARDGQISQELAQRATLD